MSLLEARSRRSSVSAKRIALLVLNASDWSRQVHSGIAAFARERGYWDFWMQPRGTRDRVSLPPNWVGDGVICRLADDELKDDLLASGLPAVNISWLGEHTPQIPKVMSDLAGCGKLCADYFLDRGFRSFAYFGPQQYLGYSDSAFSTAEETLKTAGYQLPKFNPNPAVSTPDLAVHREEIRAWVASLPKPVAVICWSTIIAREVVVACQDRDLQVPEQVAVLAIENDPVLSALSPIPISYVLQRPHVVGYAAAELLERLMQGETAPTSPILIAPEGIAEQLSTDCRFSSDEVVNEAVSYIRDNIQKAIQVGDITRLLQISRRSLEDRFRRALNRSPADEIRQVRLTRLKELLLDSSLSLSDVAHKSGFSYTEVMIRFFKRETGQTPGEYRRYTVQRSYAPVPMGSR